MATAVAQVAIVAQVRSLAWELPHSAGAMKKKKDTLIRGENTSSVISLPHVPSSLGRRFTEL